MALVSATLQSSLLHHPVRLVCLLPERQRPKAILYLLHGFSDSPDSFVRNSALERYCAQVPLAVVMPDAQCSFYLDTAYGQPYWQHISQEIPQMLRNLYPFEFNRENSFVGGVSMGGYGAAKLALTYPHRYARAFLLSPVTDLAAVAQRGFDRELDPMAPAQEDLCLDKIIGQRCISGSSDDLFHLLEASGNNSLPDFAVYVGTDDFLRDSIVRFHRALQEKNISSTLITAFGGHLWTTWEPFLEDMIKQIAAQIQ